MYKKRIIATLVTIFALGVVFAIIFRDYDTASFRALFIALISASVVVFLVSRLNNGIVISKNISAAALAVAAFSFGVLRVSLYNLDARQNSNFDGCSDTATVKVVEIDENHIDASVIESNIGVDKQTKVRLYPEVYEDKVMIGDILEVDIKYKSVFKTDLYANSIHLTGSAVINNVRCGDGLLYTVRAFVSDNAEALFGNFYSASEISKAVTTGDKSGFDSYIYSVYRSGGVSHVLAISGLHISLIAMILNRFLSSLTFGKRLSSVISIIVTFFYTALVGFTPGAVRSAVMISFLLLSEMYNRRSDGITALSIALFVLAVFNPFSIYSAGLQLSFLCCLGILVVNPFIDKIEYYIVEKSNSSKRAAALPYRIFYAVASPLIVSFAASVFSFPVLCSRFDTVSYISPLVNIIIVPIFSYSICITLVAFFVAPISTAIASVIAFPAGVIFDASTWMNAFLYENNIGITSVHTTLMYIPLALSIAMIFVLAFKRRKRVLYFTATSVIFVFALFVCCLLNKYSHSDKVYIEYVDESAEYVYFQSSEENIYFDIDGYTSDPDAVFENGKTSLDEYVVIEYGNYACQRFNYISENLKIYTVYLPKPKNIYEIGVYSQIKELANARNCDIIEYEDIYSNENSETSQLYMLKDEMLSDTILLAIEHNGTSIRFVGDGYGSPVNSDITVLIGEYEEGSYMISSENRFVKESIIAEENEKYVGFSTYTSKIRFVGDIYESEFVVYES